MPTPTYRTPVRIARGTYASLNASIADLLEGEICYATDQDRIYVKENNVLVSTQADLTPYLTTANAGTTYAPKDSPVFVGNPVGPTPALGNRSNSLATTAYVVDGFAPLNNPTFTGTVTIPAGASISGYLATGAIGVTVQGYDADTVKQDVLPTFTTATRTTERTITAGAFDLATGNLWTVGAITVPNPTNAAAGQTGAIRITAGPVVWSSNFKFPGGSAPTIATFPAIIPFYVQNSTTILMGTVVEGIA